MSGDSLNSPSRQNESLLAQGLRRFDEENAKDPNIESSAGTPWPRELLYAHRLYEWVLRLDPVASEHLLLAARSQHLCRWMIPREQYPLTREGYLKWRATLKQFHASKAAKILHELGFPPETIEKVQSLNLKKHFPNDAESRVLEDALCLVFLEHQFAELAKKTSDEKMVNALRKSWGKMTETARQRALQLPLGANEQRLLALALEGPGAI